MSATEPFKSPILTLCLFASVLDLACLASYRFELMPPFAYFGRVSQPLLQQNARFTLKLFR